MSIKKKTEPELPASYGAAMTELEQLIARLESGQLPLEELLAHYTRGTDLLTYCREKLQAVQDQVRLLDENGEAQPWKPE
ncbi:MAG: exodeoxyribonuclease VII small subunit [Ottowia sp.]|nr:exodeoxyribonuclease VII small subunit [Ottowia sp.]